MWAIEHPMLLTLLSVVAVITIAWGGLYLSVRHFPVHRVAPQMVTVALTIAMAIVFSVSIDHVWGARRDRDRRVWAARDQHRQRLQIVLRAESDSLKRLAQALGEGRYFTEVADDARKAVWQDDTLTTDVERHFPEYYQERERLIRAILEHDGERARVRQMVSATLPLTEATEAYRSELVPALVSKCGGAAPRLSFVRLAGDGSVPRVNGGLSTSGSISDAVRTYEQYRCSPDLARLCQNLFDHAADLADAASLASEAARRYAEETVLHGSCTYAPAE